MSRTYRKIAPKSHNSNFYSGFRFEQSDVSALKAGKPPHPGPVRLRPWVETTHQEVVSEKVLDTAPIGGYIPYEAFLRLRSKYHNAYDAVVMRTRWVWDETGYHSFPQDVVVGIKHKTVMGGYRSHTWNPAYDNEVADTYNTWFRIHAFVHRNGSCHRQRRYAIRILKQRQSHARRSREKRDLMRRVDEYFRERGET